MKKWEIDLITTMSKSGVDTMQKDINNFINDLFKEIESEISQQYLSPPINEDSTQQWVRMGKNRVILDMSEKIKTKYIKD